MQKKNLNCTSNYYTVCKVYLCLKTQRNCFKAFHCIYIGSCVSSQSVSLLVCNKIFFLCFTVHLGTKINKKSHWTSLLNVRFLDATGKTASLVISTWQWCADTSLLRWQFLKEHKHITLVACFLLCNNAQDIGIHGSLCGILLRPLNNLRSFCCAQKLTSSFVESILL